MNTLSFFSWLWGKPPAVEAYEKMTDESIRRRREIMISRESLDRELDLLEGDLREMAQDKARDDPQS